MKFILDQVAHMTLGAVLVVLFVRPIPLLGALALVMLLAFLRELEQHGWRVGEVGRLDLCFWFLGAAFAVLVIHGGVQ